MTRQATAPDWERIEADYRAGLLSSREIGAANGVSHTAINKRAKAGGWSKNLAAKIQAQADALVARQMVSREVSSRVLATEREIVEANAHRIAQVRSEHRQDITRMRALVLSLLEECEASTWDKELFSQLGVMLNNPDQYGKDRLNEVYRKAMELPQRIKGAKELAETLKTLVGLEREAYGLATAPELGDAPNSFKVEYVRPKPDPAS